MVSTRWDMGVSFRTKSAESRLAPVGQGDAGIAAGEGVAAVEAVVVVEDLLVEDLPDLAPGHRPGGGANESAQEGAGHPAQGPADRSGDKPGGTAHPRPKERTGNPCGGASDASQGFTGPFAEIPGFQVGGQATGALKFHGGSFRKRAHSLPPGHDGRIGKTEKLDAEVAPPHGPRTVAEEAKEREAPHHLYM